MALFDKQDPISIESYARQLENRSYKDFESGEDKAYSLRGGKGKLGQLIEESFFGYAINSRQEADFVEAGIELKVSPLKNVKAKANSELHIKREGLSVKERINITMIDYDTLADEVWESATVRKKLQLLLMFYLHESGVSVDEQVFKLIGLWKPSDKDMQVIKKDWLTIRQKVLDGEAHLLSEGDTMYLGAATKGANKHSTRPQPFSDEMARQRAFSLKRSYVDYIAEEIWLRQHGMAPSGDVVAEQSFYERLLEKLGHLEGKTISEIMATNNIETQRSSKSFMDLFTKELIGQLMGQPYTEIEEMKKSGIEKKCIVLKPDGIPKESMSFEQIDYVEIAKEAWEDSTIKDKFENKKHLWIVFRAKRPYRVQGELGLDEIEYVTSFYWNMPMEHLVTYYYDLWLDTVTKIKAGDYDHFLTSKDNPVGHIRPKAKNAEDTMVTPQGGRAKKMSFWLNNHYIATEIEKRISDQMMLDI